MTPALATAAVPATARSGRCVVMGIPDVTPDSSSDGGRHDTVAAAVAHGLRMAARPRDPRHLGAGGTRGGLGRATGVRRPTGT